MAKPTPAIPWQVLEELFDAVPDTVFFVKDSQGRYLAVNQTLVERVGLVRKDQLIGQTVHALFSAELAKRYAAQDLAVVRSGKAVREKLELHWYPRRKSGWCLTTKLPLRDDQGRVTGLIGISRDLPSLGLAKLVPVKLADALDYLENHFDEEITVERLAERAGLPPLRLARLLKKVFRLTPRQLIGKVRLAAAVRLLDETNQAIADVAHACGFYDHSAFTRAFRQGFGLSPLEFRAQRRKNPATQTNP